MKKLSLLLGTLGGALAGYVLSNDKLRNELVNAKDGQAAAKALGKHLSADGKKVGKEVNHFVKSDPVQKKLQEAKEYAKDQVMKAKEKMADMAKKGMKNATKMVKDGKKDMKKTMKKAA